MDGDCIISSFVSPSSEPVTAMFQAAGKKVSVFVVVPALFPRNWG